MRPSLPLHAWCQEVLGEIEALLPELPSSHHHQRLLRPLPLLNLWQVQRRSASLPVQRVIVLLLGTALQQRLMRRPPGLTEMTLAKTMPATARTARNLAKL